jgi:NADH:ubiquinone reductase (H+-translocating)
MSPAATETHSRIVIVGTGFGGLTAAKRLAKASLDVTIVDQRNYHLFQPLLYQVATASLSPGDIASLIRGILRNDGNLKVVLAKVSGVDVAPRGPGREAPHSIRSPNHRYWRRACVLRERLGAVLTRPQDH